jgi:hypothetical protein
MLSGFHHLIDPLRSPAMSSLSLKIWRVEQTCNFVLSWGHGTQLTAELRLFPSLLNYYQIWNKSYLDFYRSALRAKSKQSGSFPEPPIDWRVRLAQAEANLLSEFHRWLASQELIEIRQQIAKIASDDSRVSQQPPSLFLTCDNEELARLPWESWEIGREFGATGSVRWSRTPENIRQETRSPLRRRRKLRLLAILGDDTGLNFQQEREALNSLRSLLEVTFVGWQPGKPLPVLRDEICTALKDPQGWDVLFFAGHGNETQITGGELAIAPQSSILISEIAPQLAEAKRQGLQFALFNSCSGLSIAKALIDLGLSQVAIMREPIHNAVAQEFLVAFVQALARCEDAHQALRSACQFLKLERNLTFPSAALVPSLFQHPGAVPFRLEPQTFRAKLRRWLPTKSEAIVLGSLTFLSLLQPVQRELLEHRLWVQAQFRQVTGQLDRAVRSGTSTAPILLVQIDSASVQDVMVRPILSREYLSRLVRRAEVLGVSRLGLDYLFDRRSLSAPDDQQLREALQLAQSKQIKLVAAAVLEDGQWLLPNPQVAPLTIGQVGDISLYGNAQQPVFQATIDGAVPSQRFSQTSGQTSAAAIPPFAQRLVEGHRGDRRSSPDRGVIRTGWLTQLSYHLGQTWLHPLLDYSIPPERIYQGISAQDFLKPSPSVAALTAIQQQVVLIVAEYDDAGGTQDGEDNFKAPRLLDEDQISGGKVHAYQAHHWLKDAFIVPIPDVWMVLVAGVLGKGWRLSQGWGWRKRRIGWQGGLLVILYGLISLQLYVAMQVLLPWLLPMALLGGYGALDLNYYRRRR